MVCDLRIVLGTGSYMMVRNCFPGLQSIDLRALLITAGIGAALYLFPRMTKKKLSPIALICVSAVLGMIVYSI